MLLRLLPLVLGTFAIGTETFMITGVLPTIAADLQVSPAAAGGLVTIFALTYAVGSPLVAIASAGMERKRLLTLAMGAFALANLAAAFAPNFGWLLAARVLLALTAGAFVPAATAFATAMHEPSRRGRAVAFVYAGMTSAMVIGVPGGTLVAAAANWRATFLGVALLALLALAGVVAILPRLKGMGTVSLQARLAAARRPDVLRLLTLTTLTLCGAFAANTYLGVLLQATFGVTTNQLAGLLMLLGMVSFAGNLIGGYGADRWNRERFIAAILAVLIVAFVLLSVGAQLGGAAGGAIVLAGLTIWGLFGWAFPAAQQARLISLDPALAQVTLSLNASALYIGAAAGSTLGGLAIRQWSIGALGWAAALCEGAALTFLVATEMRIRATRAQDKATSCPSAEGEAASAVAR
ncbi:MFS transporter [Methylocapsa sp. S129]|uniref:MFS transporter n=1 Tax=Methylocapsa sp. S129 TaxID=1641869 RepID=UPI00131C19A3|nr:MFS transporter [Methylocapsa sp. S129]